MWLQISALTLQVGRWTKLINSKTPSLPGLDTPHPPGPVVEGSLHLHSSLFQDFILRHVHGNDVYTLDLHVLKKMIILGRWSETALQYIVLIIMPWKVRASVGRSGMH